MGNDISTWARNLDSVLAMAFAFVTGMGVAISKISLTFYGISHSLPVILATFATGVCTYIYYIQGRA